MHEKSDRADELREEQQEGEQSPESAMEDDGPAEDAALMKDRYLRTVAELRNLRMRTTREIELETRREREALLREFMEVVDNLERALGADHTEDNPWLQGMVAIREQMLELLKRHGAIPFDAADEQFDPNRHEATGTVEIPGRATGAIVDVLERGYEDTSGLMIRPAKVVVARAPAGQSDTRVEDRGEW